MDKNDFIKKVDAKYGIGRYEVIGEYKNNKTKILIRCLTCGNEWEVRPDNFLKNIKIGCPKCATIKTHKDAIMPTKEIIRIGKELYGDRYSYSKTDSFNRDENGRVCFTCNVCHMDFWEKPSNFLNPDRRRKYNCPNCVELARQKNKERKIEEKRVSEERKGNLLSNIVYDNETFIVALNNKFPNVYDTSKVNFVCLDDNVILLYKGSIVEVTPRHILRAKRAITHSFVRNKECFVKRCREVHGDEFVYDDKTVYVNSHTKITIKCKKHGYFELWPANHLNGAKCPMCRNETKINPKKKSYAQFLKDANRLHDGKYIYDEETFVNYSTPMRIICPKHGEFWQTPNSHNSKQVAHGCPVCKESSLERESRIFLKENSIEFNWSKHFVWLGKQHLDFYLPKYNIAIECQGKQHFVIGFGKDKDLLDTLIERDTRKNKLCLENGVRLLYLLPKSVNIKDVIDKSEFNMIYNEENTFKSIEKIMKKNEIGL